MSNPDVKNMNHYSEELLERLQTHRVSVQWRLRQNNYLSDWYDGELLTVYPSGLALIEAYTFGKTKGTKLAAQDDWMFPNEMNEHDWENAPVECI